MGITSGIKGANHSDLRISGRISLERQTTLDSITVAITGTRAQVRLSCCLR